MKELSFLTLAIIAVFSNVTIAKTGAHHLPEIFIGGTNANSETNFTYALEYEYKLNEDFGVGLIYEKTDEAHHGDGITIEMAAAYYHPIPSIRVGLGFGKEKLGGAHPHEEDVVRVVTSYDYHFEHFSVAPTFAVDFIDGEEAFVFGIGFIKPF